MSKIDGDNISRHDPPNRSNVLEFYSFEPGFMTLSKALTYEWRTGCHKKMKEQSSLVPIFYQDMSLQKIKYAGVIFL